MSRRVGLLDWHSKIGISQEAVNLGVQELTVGPLTNASWNIICPSDFVECKLVGFQVLKEIILAQLEKTLPPHPTFKLISI